MTTETKGTVVLGFGPQPISWLKDAEKIAGRGAVLDADIARMAGANLAAGTPEAIASLRKRLEAGATLEAITQNPGLSVDAVRWLACGQRGLSSESIFQHLTGIPTLKDHWQSEFPRTPSDPDDMRRCRLLLEQVPELEPLFRRRMASASKQWAALVQRWDEICAVMDEESPEWRAGKGRASKTYDLMRVILRGAA